MLHLRDKYQLVYKHYLFILAVALILTLFGGYFASKLTLESDLAELLPDSFESVKALNQIKDEVGAAGDLRIILESQNFAALKTFAGDLTPKLEESPFVNYVDYKNNVAFYKKNAMLFLSMDDLDSLQTSIENQIASEKAKLNPLYVADLFGDGEQNSDDVLASWEARYRDKEPKKYYTNQDSTVLVMKVIPTGTNTSLSYVQKMFDDVKQIVDGANPGKYDPGMAVYYGGSFRNRLNEYEVIKSDILGTAYAGLGGVLLLIIIYFRRLTAAILLTITLLMALAWTFGVTYLVIGSLNTITGFMFVILFGMGIDYGIHAFARYVESRRNGLSFEASMEKLIGQTGKALATTAVTTSAAFFSLTLMHFKGFSELGFIAGIGMLFAFVAMVVVLPAFITLFHKLKLLKIKPATNHNGTFQRRQFRWAKPVLLVAGLMTLFSIYAFSQVRFQYDFTNLRAMTEERKSSGEKTSGIFDLSESPAVVLADSKEEINDIVQAVERIIKQDTLTPTVDAVRSIYSLVPNNQPEKLAKIKDIRNLITKEADGVVKGGDKQRLDKLMQYLQVDKPISLQDIPEKDRRQFTNKRGEIGNFVFIYPGVSLRDGRNAIDFRNDVGEITTSSGKVYHASSSNIILAEMLTIMIREGKIAVLLTFAVVFLIVLIDLRNLKSTLFVLTPLAIGVLWMGGLMFLLGMKLNLFNIVVIPSVIGIGVDNGVHIFHRYQEEGRGSLLHVLKNTGLAISLTTLTTIVGYSGLVLARHPGLNSVGDLAIIGIGITYITAMIVLPALLQFFETGRRKKRSGRFGRRRPKSLQSA